MRERERERVKERQRGEKKRQREVEVAHGLFCLQHLFRKQGVAQLSSASLIT